MPLAMYSAQPFDQSLRNITTLPAGTRPCSASQASTSPAVAWYPGSEATLGLMSMRTSGRSANVAGRSLIVAPYSFQCAGGSSCVPIWSVESVYVVATKPCRPYVNSSPSDTSPGSLFPARAAATVAGPNAGHSGMFGSMACVRSIYLAVRETYSAAEIHDDGSATTEDGGALCRIKKVLATHSAARPMPSPRSRVVHAGVAVISGGSMSMC